MLVPGGWWSALAAVGGPGAAPQQPPVVCQPAGGQHRGRALQQHPQLAVLVREVPLRRQQLRPAPLQLRVEVLPGRAPLLLARLRSWGG